MFYLTTQKRNIPKKNVNLARINKFKHIDISHKRIMDI